MIEIIKPGNRKFTTTCTKCNCEYSYELSDIIGDGTYCPCCNKYIPHTTQFIPLYNDITECCSATSSPEYKNITTAYNNQTEE